MSAGVLSENKWNMLEVYSLYIDSNAGLNKIRCACKCMTFVRNENNETNSVVSASALMWIEALVQYITRTVCLQKIRNANKPKV